MKIIKRLSLFLLILLLALSQSAFTNSGDIIRSRGWVSPLFVGDSTYLDPDVAHGMTTLVRTDAYGLMKILHATNGGFRIIGLSDNAGATGLQLEGFISVADPTDTTPAAIINCGKLSGTTIGAIGNAETCFQVQNNGTVLETTLGDGKKGLGTATPTRLLNLYEATAPIFQLNNSSTGVTSNDGLLIQESGLNAYIENTEVGSMFFRTSSLDRITIDSTGSVGIGTTAPIYTVDSAGAINSRVYYWVEEFDDEVSGIQFEAGLQADFWVTAGTNYAAANVTYTAGVGGTLKAMCAAADNDSVTSLGVLNANVTQNPIMEVRVKIDVKETAAFYVGFASAAFADVNGAFPADAFLVGINSDNGHAFGATQIVAASVDAGAAVDYDDMGVAIVSNTYVKVKIDLTDTEQPRVWINDTEVAAGSITGTVQAGVALAPYFMVQNLAGGAIQRFITLDFIKVWQDRG